MKPGAVVRWSFVQGDGQRKLRPAIILAPVPPFNDWLVCAVSSQVHRAVEDLDVIIGTEHADFQQAGLRTASVVRVGQLATLPDRVIEGALGQVSPATLATIKQRLRDWLA